MKQFLLTSFLFVPLLFLAQTTVHYENFDAGIGTWQSVDFTDATDVWTATAGVMQMNGFGGTDDEDWLISPSINMDMQGDEYLIFEYNDGFSGPLLELYYSTDYNGGGTTGDVSAATWNLITTDFKDLNAISCFTTLMMPHRAIDVSGINGTSVHYAFKYFGPAAGCKTYKIDNFHIEADYYGAVYTNITSGVNCDVLKTEVYNSVKTANVIYYTSSFFDVWDAMILTDTRRNDADNADIVWDMFTDIPSGPGEVEFDHCTQRDDGTCSGPEGTCYNREHTFPKSWWGGGTVYPSDTQNTDLHHITPADKVLNTAKLNYAPGNVTNVTFTGNNGFVVGNNPSYPCGPTQKYYEPIDEYKGDYARIMLYMITRYEDQIVSWAPISTEGSCAMDGNTYPGYQSWLMNVLLEWHANDPVSQKEIDRNNSIYSIQGNRNPFIDNPMWVGYIWGDYLGNTCTDLSSACVPNSGSENVTACDSYFWPANSQTYTTSGSYNTILTNVGGCDSTATLNLTINYSNSGSETVTACDSYFWGATSTTYTVGGIYNTTLTNAAGCDSLVTLNLTINNSNSGSETVTACDSYFWGATSTTYTVGGIYNTTLTNAAGCDSLVTLNLTINNSNSGSETVTACDSYFWGATSTTYTVGGIYNTTLTNAAGCDSLVTLNLTINNSNSGSETITACDSYFWSANSTTYTTSGFYNATLTNVAGCDSVVTLDLTINSSPLVNFPLIGDYCNTSGILNLDQATPVGGSYSGTGVSGNSFDPSVAGLGTWTLTYDYTDGNGCSGSANSDITVTNCVGLTELSSGLVSIYPNPVHDQLNFIVNKEFNKLLVEIFDASGKLTQQATFEEHQLKSMNLQLTPGYYTVKMTIDGDQVIINQFIKD